MNTSGSTNVRSIEDLLDDFEEAVKQAAYSDSHPMGDPGNYYKHMERDEAHKALMARLAPEPAARLEYQPGSLTEEEIAGGADIPNCLRCGRTLFGGHSHDSRWYCSSETKAGSES